MTAAKTTKQLDAEIRAAAKRGHGDTTTEGATHCNTCSRPVASPFRRYSQMGGTKITAGCIDAAHTGHLYGDSLRWHMRPEAKKLRADAVARLRGLLSGTRAK